MVSQITGVSRVCSTVCSGADERKHQSSASLAFVRGIHRWLINSIGPFALCNEGLLGQQFFFISILPERQYEYWYTSWHLYHHFALDISLYIVEGPLCIKWSGFRSGNTISQDIVKQWDSKSQGRILRGLSLLNSTGGSLSLMKYQGDQMSCRDLTHYTDVIMTTVASQITSLTVVYSKKTSKLRVTGLCVGQLRGKSFRLMTSLCTWKVTGTIISATTVEDMTHSFQND